MSPAQEELVAEEWRGLVNGVRLNPDDATDVIVELVLPNNIGGFWIREWGLFDEAGKLVAVGPHDEMHKPLIASGQAAEYLELFHLPVTQSGAVKLTIATQALATQGFVRDEIDQSLAAHAALIVNPEDAGHLPAFGSAPQNAAPVLNAAGEAVWQVGVTPVYLNQAFDFHAYYAENFYGVVGPDVPGTWVNMPPCLKSSGSLYGGFFDVKTEPAGSAVLRYTIWESGPYHGIEYVCTRQTGIAVWSEWQHNGWQPDYARQVVLPIPTQSAPFIMPYNGFICLGLSSNLHVPRASLMVNNGEYACCAWDGKAYTTGFRIIVPVKKNDVCYITGGGTLFQPFPCRGE